MALPSRWKETHQFGRIQSNVSDHPVQCVLVNKSGGKASVNRPRVLFLFPAAVNAHRNLINMRNHT
nr:MAG TPA_asm: hypothetical protein [Caudoviricetes sp.]